MESMPTVSTSAYVDESASIIGDVRIGERVYVAPGVSLRADEATPIIIGDECIPDDLLRFNYEVTKVNVEFAVTYGVRRKSCVGI